MMGSFVVFLSLVPILLIIVMIFVLKSKIKLFQKLKRQWILISYVALLLATMVFYSFLPDMPDETPILKKVHGEGSHTDLWNLEQEGTLSEKGKEYLVEKWEFSLKDNELKVNPLSKDFIEMSVSFGKSNREGILEIEFYQTPIEMNGLLYELKDIPVPILKYTDGELLIDTNEQEINFSRYKLELPFRQFKNKKSENGLFESDISLGENLLYIKIPPDTLIKEYDGESYITDDNE